MDSVRAMRIMMRSVRDCAHCLSRCALADRHSVAPHQLRTSSKVGGWNTNTNRYQRTQNEEERNFEEARSAPRQSAVSFQRKVVCFSVAFVCVRWCPLSVLFEISATSPG